MRSRCALVALKVAGLVGLLGWWGWVFGGALPAEAADRGEPPPAVDWPTWPPGTLDDLPEHEFEFLPEDPAHQTPIPAPAAAPPEAGHTKVEILLEEARGLEAEGRWSAALTRYEEAQRSGGDLPEALEGASRCRLQMRVDLRCQSEGTRDFALGLTASRGVALYEELIERIVTSYVDETVLSDLVARGVDNCILAAHNPTFVRTYRAESAVERVKHWDERMAAIRSGLTGHHLTPAEAGVVLQRVLKTNLETLAVPDGALAIEMIHGAVDDLDGYSAFLNPQRLQALRTEIDGEFVGLGIRIALRDGALVVVEPIAGGPAARAGVRAGDRLLAVDGRSTEGLNLSEAARFLRGPDNSAVVIEVRHEGAETSVVLTLRRERVVLKSVVDVRRVGAETQVGYLRVASFQKGTPAEVEEALKALEGQGVKGLIVDLRNNPGGVLDASVDVANAFIRHGVVVSTHGRAWGQNWTFRARAEGTHPDYPLVVLVDGMTASASEIVASALQDHRRAVLIGTRTYGKGSVQSLFKLGRGEVGLRLTTAKFYAPSGRCFDGVGLTPDVEVKETGDGRAGEVDDEDPQLRGAIRFLETRLLAGVSSPEAAWSPK